MTTLDSARPASRLRSVLRWFDSYQHAPDHVSAQPDTVDWLRALPFVVMHLACFSVIYTGWSMTAILVSVAMYALRMFAITGFYHRYFSHKTFKTSRAMQFVFALLGASAVQRGPLWWASHHRHHHAHSDRHDDNHSPDQKGFAWSHVGWFLSNKHFPVKQGYIRDYKQYPELQFIDRFDFLVPAVYAVTLFIIGELLAFHFPELGTNGWQLVVWGFVISTVALYHATFTINSLAHRYGKRRFATSDNSRNSFWLALLTFGEGWHNNHHFYPGSARQGFAWWEIDVTYYGLKILSWVGLIWDLRPVPDHVHNARISP